MWWPTAMINESKNTRRVAMPWPATVVVIAPSSLSGEPNERSGSWRAPMRHGLVRRNSSERMARGVPSIRPPPFASPSTRSISTPSEDSVVPLSTSAPKTTRSTTA